MSKLPAQQYVEIQGHRGARAVFPENSIPGFIYALDQGVHTLEMDVVISADGQVVVSHEPWVSAEICEVDPHQEKLLNIYQMPYEDLVKYDCGLKPHPRFPNQIKMASIKPLLADVISTAERHMKGVTLREFDYNIEIKTTPQGDGVFHPNPDEFAETLYRLINQYLPWERVVIQSFDIRPLQYLHANHPNVRLSLLVEDQVNPEKQLKELGFTPEVYSPDYQLLTDYNVRLLKKLGLKVIPWTINDKEVMLKLIRWGVDGIITDLPNMANSLGLTQETANQ